MRLVGATRWFIRWPFMIEGVVVGFVGGLVAILILWLGKITIVDPLSDSFSLPRGAEQQHALASRPWSRSSSPPRCWSRRSAPASPCAASSRSERRREGARGRGLRRGAGRRALRRALARRPPGEAAAASSATPSSTTPAGLSAEATEADRGQLLPPGRRRPSSTTPRCRAWSGSCASATTTASPTTSRRKPGTASTRQIEGRFSGVGLTRDRGQEGACGSARSSTARRPTRPGSRPGDMIVSVDGDSIAGAEQHRGRRAKIKGPEGTEVTIGVRDARTGKVRQLTPDPGRGRAAERQQQGRDGRTGASSATCACSPSAKAPTPLLRERGATRSQREGARGDRARPARQRRRPARRGGAQRQHLPARGRSRRLDRLAHPGPRVYKTVGGNLPQLPIVVLIDRNTASAAEILTAALADDAGAEVVGTRSYGKGVFQQEIDLSNGGALKLTVGEYFTPDGRQPGRATASTPTSRSRDDPRTQARRGARSAALGGRWPVAVSRAG